MSNKLKSIEAVQFDKANDDEINRLTLEDIDQMFTVESDVITDEMINGLDEFYETYTMERLICEMAIDNVM